MSLKDDIAAFEKVLSDAGANLDTMLARAGVNRSTWTRWKNGSVKGARYDTIARVKEAVDEAVVGHTDATAPSEPQGAAA